MLNLPDYLHTVGILGKCIQDRGTDYVYSNPEMDAGSLHYTGPQCLYTHKDEEGNLEPGCIVGLFLYKLGHTLEEIRAGGAGDAPAILSTLGYSVDRNNPVVHLLMSVQGYQDEKTPWGEAFAKAVVDVRNWYDTFRATDVA